MTGKGGLYYPLDAFYEREGRTLPPCVQLPADELPEPYRKLLAHDDDMTPTLAAFHSDMIALRVLKNRQEGRHYWRMVVLNAASDGRPVEFGAIHIDLELFDAESRAHVLEGRRPLGAILAYFNIKHESSPSGFFQVESDGIIGDALRLPDDGTLYGRRNTLTAECGGAIAQIVEVLPPHPHPNGKAGP